jgi:hypothetical protein
MEATVVSNADSAYLLDVFTPTIWRRDGSVVYRLTDDRAGWLLALEILDRLNGGAE